MKIGWIGTGIMGGPMALHLAQKGYDVTAYNRTMSKAERLTPHVKLAYTIESLVKDKDVIFTIVGYPKDVDEVIHEVFKYAQKDTIIIDMTTSSPILAKRLFDEGFEKGFHLLDAPVTGGELGAKAGALSIMVGGDARVFKKVQPLFEAFGTKVNYMGKAGFGQYTKLANQIAIAGSLAGVVESMYYALSHHLDLTTVIDVLKGGSAGSNQLIQNARKIADQNYEPGFFVKHFLKDLKLAIETIDTDLLVAKKVKEMLDVLVSEGYENEGTQALIRYYLDSLMK